MPVNLVTTAEDRGRRHEGGEGEGQGRGGLGTWHPSLFRLPGDGPRPTAGHLHQRRLVPHFRRGLLEFRGASACRLQKVRLVRFYIVHNFRSNFKRVLLKTVRLLKYLRQCVY